jgi:bifunctional enzyme CysN/CysC
VKQIIVLVNKMDLKSYDEKVFRGIETEYRAFLKQFGLEPRTFIPISAKVGDNVANKSEAMPWYRGKTVLEAIDEFEQPKKAADLPLRLPLQDVYRFDHRRILAGRIVSGTIRVGDRVVFLPGNKVSTVKTVERWSAPASEEAGTGESIGITLTEQIFVERGQIAVHESEPLIAKRQFKARLFWMGRQPLRLKKRYKIKLTTQELECEVKSIDKVIDASTLGEVAGTRDHLNKNDVAEITIHTKYPLAFDNLDRVVETGRFVIVDDKEVSGGGIISGEAYPSKVSGPKSDNISWSRAEIGYNERAVRNRHEGAVLWLTGLSGAGKSAIAHELERELFGRGMQAYSLDGDNLRFGLNSDLGFSPEDRSENIRRAAEVARILADSGQIVVTSFISPYRADRHRVREIMRENDVKFFEVFVRCPLTVCEQRDPKGLYKKARAGQITDFTGISAPYEEPEKPEIVVDTDKQTLPESVTHILEKLIPAVQVKAEGAESFEI